MKCKQEYKGKTEFVSQRLCAKSTSLLCFYSDLNGKYWESHTAWSMPLEHRWASEEHSVSPLLITQCCVPHFSPARSAQVTLGYSSHQHTTSCSTCCRTGLSSSLLLSSLSSQNSSTVQPQKSWAKVLNTALSLLSCLLPGPVSCKAATYAPLVPESQANTPTPKLPSEGQL